MFASKDMKDLLLWLPVTSLAWYSMSLDLIQENLGMLLFGSEMSPMLKIGAIREHLSSKNEVLNFIFNHYNDCMGLHGRAGAVTVTALCYWVCLSLGENLSPWP